MLFKKLYSMFPVGWGEGGKGLKSVLFDIGTISLSLEDHNNTYIAVVQPEDPTVLYNSPNNKRKRISPSSAI